MRRAKVVLVGATHTGKTSIVNRFIFGDFTLHTVSTTQPAFSQKVMNHKGVVISLEIWDTAGQDRYHSLSPLFYRDAEAGIVVFDITDTETFTKASKWISELKQERGDEVMMIVVGNKIDLEARRTVDKADGQQLAASANAPYFETSAKTNENVDAVFQTICETVVQKTAGMYPKAVTEPAKSLKSTVTIADDTPKVRKGCC
jgi:small GTP-binding protein